MSAEPQDEGPSGLALLLAWSAILLLVGFLGGLGLGRALWAPQGAQQAETAIVAPPETCVVGVVGIPGPYAGLMSVFGEAELCFSEIRWSGIYGPTMPPDGGQR